jgi:hypothetical protein
MASPEFKRFEESFLDNPSSSVMDGLDMDALLSLQGAERERAEAVLLQRLDEDDMRAIIGLGALRSPRAKPGLERIFHKVRGEAQGIQDLQLVETSRALWRIAPDQRWLGAVLDVLRGSTFEQNRHAAAGALEDFRHSDAERALIETLDAPDKLLRYRAAWALLAMHGIPFNFADNEHAVYRVMASDPAKRAEARQDILAMIAHIGSLPR